jgi:hypothetical protein
MVENPDLITSVMKGTGSTELFFLYKAKYNWSVSKNASAAEYFLHFYPTGYKIQQLARIEDWDEFSDFVTYRSADLGGKEAQQSFAALYGLVQEKLFGMDKVLDDILSDDLL